MTDHLNKLTLGKYNKNACGEFKHYRTMVHGSKTGSCNTPHKGLHLEKSKPVKEKILILPTFNRVYNIVLQHFSSQDIR